jgi:hypothetical protein
MPMRRALVRATAIGSAALVATQPTYALSNESNRLRRQSTTPQRYTEGQPVRIVRVPQRLLGVNVGHISVLVQNHDGSTASLGFYSQNYRQGLPLFQADPAILLTPDPLYTRCVAAQQENKPEIIELYRGKLTAAQAAWFNEWTDDSTAANGMELTRFTTSAGVQRELGVVGSARLDDAQYRGIALHISCGAAEATEMRLSAALLT